MKKKTLSIALIAALLIALMTGCGLGSEDTQTGEAAASESGITYEYEQELNIIDDNYRNYYEIFVYSFYDSDGDGIGDLNGVTEKLDYIQEMGFNGIWLMPIMPSTTYHKYDVIDYCDIDEEYGTLEDFENLVAECHDRGIRIIIDFVMNHSSSKNPWFLDACNYLKSLPEDSQPDLEECPYVDYYHFTKEPIGSTYYEVPGTSWYYEGAFWSEMPDLNLESETVRNEFEDIAKFWIDLGVDGFRMDAALHFEENNTDANNEILNWLYSYCKTLNPDFYMVSEVWASESTIASYYESQTPSMFNFPVSSAEGILEKTAMGSSNATKLVNAMLNYQETYSAANPDYIDAVFLTNHDQVRVANNLISNEDNLKMAAGLLMMMNGNPFVYYGEEIGMKSSGTEDENKRLPMYWSETDTEGMTDGPSAADKDIKPSFPAWDEQLEDETSLLNYYRRALRLRNENPEIARGTIAMVDSLCEGDQAAITKTYEGSTIGIVYNTSEEEIAVSISGTELEAMGIRGYLTKNGEEITLEGGILTMPAQSICILK
jgi:glycosidase